jgi:hypothetical protein
MAFLSGVHFSYQFTLCKLCPNIEGNGFLDLMMFNSYGHHHLYKNHGGNGNGWIRARAVHKNADQNTAVTDSYGAIVSLKCATAGVAMQYKEVGAATHYMGQSEMMLHFGLGSDGKCKSATVVATWPAWGSASVTVVGVTPSTTLTLVRPANSGATVSEKHVDVPACPSAGYDVMQHAEESKQERLSAEGLAVTFPDTQAGRTAVYTIPSAAGGAGGAGVAGEFVGNNAAVMGGSMRADSFNLMVSATSPTLAKRSVGTYTVTVTFVPPPTPPPPPGSVPPTSSLQEESVDWGVRAGVAMPRMCPQNGYADQQHVIAGACHPYVQGTVCVFE